MKRKVPLNQLEIPVPYSPRAKATLTEEDKALMYGEVMGEERLLEQMKLAEEARRCKCGRDPAPGWMHKAGCPRRPVRTTRNPTYG